MINSVHWKCFPDKRSILNCNGNTQLTDEVLDLHLNSEIELPYQNVLKILQTIAFTVSLPKSYYNRWQENCSTDDSTISWKWLHMVITRFLSRASKIFLSTIGYFGVGNININNTVVQIEDKEIGWKRLPAGLTIKK